VAANVLHRNFTATRPNQKWAGDITYIATGEGWLYLAVLMDLYSRRIVGWAMGMQSTTALTLQALEMALHNVQSHRNCSIIRTGAVSMQRYPISNV